MELRPDPARVDSYIYQARMTAADWAADPVDPEAKRLEALNKLHALYRDPATPKPIKCKVRRFFQQEWDGILLDYLAHPSLGEVAAAARRFLLGKNRPGPRRQDERNFKIAMAVREKQRRDSMTYKKAVEAVAEENKLSFERVRNIYTKLGPAAKAEFQLRAEQQAFRATMPERWADFVDEQRASDDGMPPGKQDG